MTCQKCTATCQKRRKICEFPSTWICLSTLYMDTLYMDTFVYPLHGYHLHGYPLHGYVCVPSTWIPSTWISLSTCLKHVDKHIHVYRQARIWGIRKSEPACNLYLESSLDRANSFMCVTLLIHVCDVALLYSKSEPARSL